MGKIAQLDADFQNRKLVAEVKSPAVACLVARVNRIPYTDLELPDEPQGKTPPPTVQVRPAIA